MSSCQLYLFLCCPYLRPTPWTLEPFPDNARAAPASKQSISDCGSFNTRHGKKARVRLYRHSTRQRRTGPTEAIQYYRPSRIYFTQHVDKRADFHQELWGETGTSVSETGRYRWPKGRPMARRASQGHGPRAVPLVYIHWQVPIFNFLTCKRCPFLGILGFQTLSNGIPL
jgi:hypothetical protein